MSRFDFRPYVSGDLEFLALDHEKAEITQMGFVLDTAEYGDVRKFPVFHCFIAHDSFHAENTAMYYNIPYLVEYQKYKKGESKEDWFTPKQAVHFLLKFLDEAKDYAISTYDKAKGWEKPINHVQIFGKNFGFKDAQVLLYFTKRHAPEKYEEMTKAIGYHFGDAGSAMFPYFGYVPGLSAINEQTGRTEVNHNAYDDAVDVIFGVRAAFCGLRDIKLSDTTFDGNQVPK